MATGVGAQGARRVGLRSALNTRTLVARSAIVLVGFMAAVSLIAPLRRDASNAASRVIFWVMAPLAPSIGGFSALPQPTRVLAADGSELGRIDGPEGSQPVALASLPSYVPKAVLAAEDADFYHHSGVNPAAIARATISIVRGHPQGGSTITQQLAKLDYTGSRRTVLRKLREVLYAVRLERTYSKDRLLEQYLNQVYFGNGTYGIRAAAQAYFGVSADKLDVDQAASLAGKIHAPTLLDPYQRAPAVVARRNEVLRLMVSHHWLSRAELDADERAPLQVRPPVVVPRGLQGHFIDYVQREAVGLDALGASPEGRTRALFTGGYAIQTTFDPHAFNAAVEAIRAHLGRPGDPSASVACVQPGDGAIRALVGGLDPNEDFDVTSQGERQPGSAFKPFVYLAALRKGIDPRTTLRASQPMKLTYQGDTFTVYNYDGEGGGMMSIDNGLVRSVNTVFAQLGLAVTPQQVVAAAEDAGIHGGIRAVPAVALGGLNRGVSPLEMAAAYSTFAARGLYAAPYAVTRILDRRGRLVYAHDPQTRQAFDPNQVGVLTATLERVVTQGTGTAAAIARPVAGKTGTTSNFSDAWFVGYVPQLATAVWVGDPQRNTPMSNVHGVAVAGGTYPARIFADTMRAALAGLPVEPLFTATPDSLSLQFGLSPGRFVPTLPPATWRLRTTEPSTTSLSSVTTVSPTSSSLGETATTATTSTPTTRPSPSTTNQAPTPTAGGP